MLGKDPIPNYLSFQYAATSRSDRSRTIRNPEKTGPGAAPAEFHFHGFRIGHYRCHFDIATALSQADRAFRYGRPRRNLLFRISTFRTRYRKRPCYRNESGCRETANEICTRRFFIYYRSFSAVSGGVIKIIKFSFPAKSCISIYPG